MAQALSEHAPKASFMHAAPGFVSTALSKNLPVYLRVPLNGLSSVFARAPETCAKYMVSALLNDDYASGWKLLGQNAQEVTKTKFHTEENKNAVWNHTLKTINDITNQ
ncbi:unnamed protein product [Phytophthora fragariaefolia]|uniref:Unnamed protein product n=1 Tax=Phytophthora fragariaefolia TaxID=1490495 RepID=A0A9W6XCR5_9STRA|nr:unnamed protein product [Phytophthora fragariaefolia]